MFLPHFAATREEELCHLPKFGCVGQRFATWSLRLQLPSVTIAPSPPQLHLSPSMPGQGMAVFLYFILNLLIFEYFFKLPLFEVF